MKYEFFDVNLVVGFDTKYVNVSIPTENDAIEL